MYNSRQWNRTSGIFCTWATPYPLGLYPYTWHSRVQAAVQRKGRLPRVINRFAASGIVLPKSGYFFLLTIDRTLTRLHKWEVRLAGTFRSSRQIRMWMSTFLFCTFAALICIGSAYFSPLLCCITALALYLVSLVPLTSASLLLHPFSVLQEQVPHRWFRLSLFTCYYRQGGEHH